jgi:hypothetical protein
MGKNQLQFSDILIFCSEVTVTLIAEKIRKSYQDITSPDNVQGRLLMLTRLARNPAIYL